MNTSAAITFLALVIGFTVLCAFAALGLIRKRFVLILALIALAAVSCTGCGGGGDEAPESAGPNMAITPPNCATGACK